VLRGFAITGVLFAYVFWNLGTEPSSTYTTFDNILDQVGYFLIDSKCYTILACLFSVGFVLHMNKSSDLAKSLQTYRRRLLGLFIIGMLHALLLRNGDILAPYAILTFAVTFFYGSSKRAIIFFIILVFLIQAELPQVWLAFELPLPERPVIAGNYWVENFGWVKYWYVTSVFFWETTLILLLIGLLIGRTFIQRRKKLSNQKLIAIAIIGFTIGTFSYLAKTSYQSKIEALPDVGNTYVIRVIVHSLLGLMHKIGMASSFASIVFLLAKNFRLALFANLGRMSLTNYVVQAVIIVPFCLAFDLFDHITPTIALVMTAAIWVWQALFCSWWLARHQFGPLEWLLRRFTYGKIGIAKEKNHLSQLISARL
jgi:uncharacterized protein